MSVVIGIPTKGRRAPLFRLLRSVVASCKDHKTVPTVLIVQNDPVFSLENDAELRDVMGPVPYVLCHEPRSGLSYVRNRLLQEADALGHDWFFGLDDDEWVSPAWYGAMVEQAETRGGSLILFGPCVLVYDDTLSPLREPHRPEPLPTGSAPQFCATHNFAMHRRVFAVDAAGHRFSPFFNLTGGEDEEFFARVAHYGDAEMIWVAEAIAYEERIGERGTLWYQMMRTRRIVLSRYRIKQHHDILFGTRNALSGPMIFFVSNRRIVKGIIRSLYNLVSIPKKGAKAKHNLGKAIVMISNGLAGYDYLLGRKPVYYGTKIDNVQVRATDNHQ